MQKGCIQLYYGDGKGKTTAAIGQIVRCVGHGFKVLVYQFLKEPNSGEVSVIKSLPGVEYIENEGPIPFMFNLTPEQQEVIDECGKLATDYEREINRAGDDEIMSRWQKENGVTITQNEDMDIDSFKKAVDGIDEWYQKELEDQGYDDAKELIAAFQ